MITTKGKARSHGKYLGAVLGFTGAVALAAFFAVSGPLATTAGSHDGPPASMASSGASAAVAPAATMDIVPTPAIVADSGRFAGTGDGSEGSWVGR